jgi:hypothetical protein
MTSDREWNQILNEPDVLQRTQDIVSRVSAIQAGDISAAMREAEKSPNNDLALSLLASRWVSLDPQGAQDAIIHTVDRRVQYLLMQGVYSALAQQNPEEAVRASHQLPTQAERDSAMNAIISQVAKQDAPRALRMCLDAKIFSGGALNSVFTQWAGQDIPAATQAALALPRSGDRSSAIMSMSTKLEQDDPAAAAAWVDQLPPGSAQTAARDNIVGRWAFNDAPAAAAYVLSQSQLPITQERSMVQGVAVSWAQSDPRSACEWARKLQPEAAKLGLQMALNSWGRTDARDATDFLATLSTDAKTKAQLAESLTQAWTLNDPQGALAWATQLPPGPMRDRAITGVVNQWGVLDPARAAGYIQSLPPGIQRRNALSQMADAWSRDDPASAVKWAQALTDDSEKSDLLSSITRTWAGSDPVAASNWLAQLPTGPSRDNVVRIFSDQVFENDPPAAFQWASSISDASMRQEQVISTLRRWMSTDRAAAMVAIQQSDLAPEARKQLLDSTP